MLGKLYKIRAKRQYSINSIIQDRKSVVFLSTAKCRNSGDKSNIYIGNHCTIGGNFIALFGGVINVGNNVYVGPNTIIEAKEGVYIEDNVIIANDVLICDNNNHPTSPADRMKMSECSNYLTDPLWSWNTSISKKIRIESNVWIGRDARILKGVTIGKGSIVALGAVVTHDVPPYSIVAGNPAKVVKILEEERK